MSALRNLLRADPKCIRSFLFNFAWKGFNTFRRFEKRRKNGSTFPAFQFISVTNQCNLSCQGCWVSQEEGINHMEFDILDRIIRESNDQGSWFFGILGGEPLLYPELTRLFRMHPKSYFQLFTNGTLLNEKMAGELRKTANVTPLISFEGDETVADIRRGGSDVYKKTIRAIETSVAGGLITGVAVSVCKSNIDMALSGSFVEMMDRLGIVYLWYYIYRPVGAQPCYKLALSSSEIERLRRFLVDGRSRYPIALIDSYWDADGNPFCPAAEGLSHHINPAGHIEPCPVIQYSCGMAGADLKVTYENSVFLRGVKEGIHQQTRGCILMENPAWLPELARQHHACNTSGRPSLNEQLKAGCVVCSHASCPVIPEKNRLYRFAKRRAFFGMSAYG
ncbi:MAG: radical SAM protein [Alphaproteobacteria bacterium]|nr:radical SAM protein [Alphaproteobacteria bacterium]